ncbi:HAD family hydrolase [Myceligenerans xiligouense]|uniref:Hydroxymethylpyrimidine pyrophosphatase-like HAD family hydrolase n=1 Tax=Myceligenerans xiligouense TaxID=253184 RepID=A0A3N4YMV9_9MICO|nr:HAD family hydrolase [Myceligenerans xiligouense]RPF20786.1 hydroxymethylpyrimidine pyrophosphatase-like HAD family hydrolase [Myceligenerans xiligouense]
MNTTSTAITATAQLVALDIDGTILETGLPPSDLVVHEVRAVAGAGHHVALATGRSLAGAVPVAWQLGLRDGWLITSNGAITARISGGKVKIVERHDIDVEAVVRHVAPKLRLRIAAEIPGHGYRIAGTFAPHELSGVLQPANLEGLWAAPSPRVALVGAGAGWLVEDLRATGLTANAPHSEWVDVTPGGVSKATSLERVRVAVGVPSARTVAVGDGRNDIDMLHWAARGVAMGHAPMAVREAANKVTGTIADDGVVPVLRSIAGWPAAVAR